MIEGGPFELTLSGAGRWAIRIITIGFTSRSQPSSSQIFNRVCHIVHSNNLYAGNSVALCWRSCSFVSRFDISSGSFCGSIGDVAPVVDILGVVSRDLVAAFGLT